MATYYCPHHDAMWAAQWMDGAAKPPTFALIGSHYRGHDMVKMCDTCKNTVQGGGHIRIQRIGLWFDLKAGRLPAVRIGNPPHFQVKQEPQP